MLCPVIISLDQSLHFGLTQVGTQGVVFGKLFAEDIPVPETAIIPPETFYRLAQENNLFALISQVSYSDDLQEPAKLQRFKKHIIQVVTSQKLPSWFLNELLSTYHRKFSEGFIVLSPSHHFPRFNTSEYMHIQGEANLIESLLKAWADLIFFSVEKHGLIRPIYLAPTPIMLQVQYQPVVSGLGYTAHPQKMSKTQVLIQSIWGSPDPHLLLEESDSFAVDVRSWQTLEQHIGTKTKQCRREADKVVFFAVPNQYQNHPTLTPVQVAAIAQIIFAIKQKRLSHQIISWELSKEGIFITNLRENQLDSQAAPTLKKTITKLYISTGNPQKHLPHLMPVIDGVGILRSEYTLAKFGVHPMHVIASKQKPQLLKELVNTIYAYQSGLQHKPIIYRSQNFTSSELRQLKYSENYEPAEPNPYIGYRGGLQMVRQPQLLEFELDVLRAALEQSKSPLGFMPSFVRAPHELEFIISEVEKAGLFTNPHFSMWLQLNTPENILNLRGYPTHKLAGISVNIKSLHALLLGIDPDNPEISEHYALDTTVVEKLMEQLAQTVQELQTLRNFTQPLQFHLHLEDFSHDLVALAVKLGYHGVTVKPAAAQIAHATIVEIEEKQLAMLQ